MPSVINPSVLAKLRVLFSLRKGGSDGVAVEGYLGGSVRRTTYGNIFYAAKVPDLLDAPAT
jgi:hypothetical protein